MVTYERYKKLVDCPKCSNEHLTSEYVPATDLIKRKCLECGYEFYQMPHDRQVTPGANTIPASG